MLEFQNVSLAGLKDKHLDEINFKISQGENVVIPNWSVEYDVFFMAILRMKKTVVSGKIFFEGKDIQEKNRESLLRYRRKIGYVPVYKGLLKNLTVQENILLPMQIMENYNEKQMFERFDELKDFFLKDINCDMTASALSAEEEKRAMLARAVAASPKLLLLNCPFLGIELKFKDNISSLIHEAIFCRKLLPQDSAVILSTEYSSLAGIGKDDKFREFSLTTLSEN